MGKCDADNSQEAYEKVEKIYKSDFYSFAYEIYSSVVLIAQSCPTVCDPMDCSPSSSFVHGILQVGTLEWVAISFSRGFSQPVDWTQVSCIAGRFLLSKPPEKRFIYNLWYSLYV